MHNSSTLTRFLVGISALIVLGVGIRLMYYGLQTQLSSSPSLGIVAFVVGILCFIGGILIGVLLFDRYSRRV